MRELERDDVEKTRTIDKEVWENFFEYLKSENFVGWPDTGFVEWTWGTAQGTGGHPLQEGHKRIAEKLYEACNTTR